MKYQAAEFKKPPIYPIGSVPRAGWFAIEPACVWTDKRPAEGEESEPQKVTCKLDAKALQQLANNFISTAERGLSITADHSFVFKGDSRSIGWVRALVADGDTLYAWIEWTDEGHSDADTGAYVFFSTEYEWDDFVIEAGHYVPQRLSGFSLTNRPRHA